jgi:hypothetical protein
MTLRHIEKCIMAVACAATLAAPGPGLAQTAKPPSPVAAPASAPAPAPTPSLPLPLAREVAQRTIQLVETKALLPRVPDEYAQAKSSVLALLDQDGGEIDRRELYARLNALLRTLDVDGHSFISSPSAKSSASATTLSPPRARRNSRWWRPRAAPCCAGRRRKS